LNCAAPGNSGIALEDATPALSARTQATLTLISKGSDVQLYLKTKYNFVRTWDQEFGVAASLVRYGNGSLIGALSYDPTYPISFHKKPRICAGFQFTYTFTSGPEKLGVYTKPKTTFLGLWKEETGLTGRLYASKSLIVSANLATIFDYPYKSNAKPQFVGGICFGFPLGR